MTLQELTPKQAQEIATELVPKILAEGREFSLPERELIRGLTILVSASNVSMLAEFWRERKEPLNFHKEANLANAYFARFEEAKALIEQHLVSRFRENSYQPVGEQVA